MSETDSEKPRALVGLEDTLLEEFPWGRIRWSANAELGESEHITVGRVDINPRCENPKHYHPNCDEVVYVLSGRITHLVGDESFEMKAGDATIIPKDVPHQAINNEEEKTELLVTYNTGQRQTVGEGLK